GPDHKFGGSVAVGSLRGSLLPDLAFGAPEEDVPGASLGGTAALLLSGSSPLKNRLSQDYWDQPRLPSHPPANLYLFGSALAIGHLRNDGQGDLASGIPGFNGGGIWHLVAVQILYGALFADDFDSKGLTAWSNF